MRTIAVVTGARSDFGIWLPVLRAIRQESSFRLRLLVCAMHLAPEFGHTIDVIRQEGFEPDECIETLLAGDTPQAVAKSMGLSMIGFAQEFSRNRPDLLMLLGDRTETFAAGCAALPFAIPIGHVHGGEVTEGAIDEAMRHALTKMAHIHFPTTLDHGRRIIQLGEAAERVFVCGAPSLDNLKTVPLLSRGQLEERLGLALDQDPVLVTYHPVTLESDDTDRQIADVLAALADLERPLVLTYPNADTHGRAIVTAIDTFVASHPNARAVTALGTQGYFSLMNLAAAMVGNSSSGLIEAPSFKLPVVNIGDRQKGRLRAGNVVDCACDPVAIRAAMAKALEPGFRSSLSGLVNPYGQGDAGSRILNALRSIPDYAILVKKAFHDLPVSAP